MARRRRKEKGPLALLELLPLIVGFLFLASFVSPQFRQFLGGLFALVIWLLIAAAVGFVAWVFWKRSRRGPVIPSFIVGADPKRMFADEFRGSPIFNQPAPRPPSPWPTPETTAPRQPAPLRGWSLRLLNEIEWHRFEQLVAAYEREIGNDAELTPFGPDGGVDVLVFDKGSRTPKRAIQCKAYEKDIGVDKLRSFVGAMRIQKVPRGAFFTTGRFSNPALAESRAINDLELVDGSTFLNRIQRLHPPAQQRLLAVATEGDYTTPTCANCGIKLTFHPVTKGAPYWECRNRPRCKSRIYVSRTA